MELFARKCDVTGVGMNEGWVVGDGVLVYNKGHKGSRYGFSDEYFIDLYDGKFNILSNDEQLLASGLSWHDAQVFCDKGKRFGLQYLIEEGGDQ